MVMLLRLAALAATATAAPSVDEAAADVRAAREALRAAEARLDAAQAQAAAVPAPTPAPTPEPALVGDGRGVYPSELPFLFMDLDDVQDPWGLMWPEASTMAADADFKPPPLPYDTGATVISVLPAWDFASSGDYEVYASNTTGWEPLSEPELDEPRPDRTTTRGADPYPECGREKTCPVSLLRYTTKDFVSYSPPHLSLYITNAPGGGGTPTVKSLARNDDTVRPTPPHPTPPHPPPSRHHHHAPMHRLKERSVRQGLYVLFACDEDSCSHTFTSTDHGIR